jgi:hypothetical protein
LPKGPQPSVAAAGTRIRRVLAKSSYIASRNRAIETDAHDPTRHQTFDQRVPTLQWTAM